MYRISIIIFYITTSLFVSFDAFALDTVTLVCENDFAPYGYESKNGEASGFSTDIIIAAYKSVGVDVNFKVLPYAHGMHLVENNIEIGCYNTNNDEINLKKHHFPDEPLFTGEFVLWALSDYQGNMTLEKLIETGETVGITHGYNYDGPGVNFDYNEKIKKDVARTVTLTLKKLVGGRYKFAAAEKKVALLAISRNKSELEGKIKIVGRISNGGLFVSFSKKHPYGKKYCDLLNQGIVNIKNSGEYETLEKKWDSLIQSGNLP